MHQPHDRERIRLAHGGGGRLMRELIREIFVDAFTDDDVPPTLEDAALVPIEQGEQGEQGKKEFLAFTTDAFVVDPIFFPGGTIGDLAIHGTVNDLAMMGAMPLCLSVAAIIEEGFPMASLERIVTSMATSAKSVPVRVVTGDTKVVPRGKADGIFLTTTGIGKLMMPSEEVTLSAGNLKPGDRLLVSGPVGNHGIAVMSRRAGLSFKSFVQSDTAPLCDLVAKMLRTSQDIHALRDPTRGGLAAALFEFADDSGVLIEVQEQSIPVDDGVRAACDILGFDPLHVPCEGCLLAAVAPAAASEVLAAMQEHPLGKKAADIGEVRSREDAGVLLRTRVGGTRLLDLPSGELLPRIC